jgi:hypothetical protein
VDPKGHRTPPGGTWGFMLEEAVGESPTLISGTANDPCREAVGARGTEPAPDPHVAELYSLCVRRLGNVVEIGFHRGAPPSLPRT